MPRSRRDRAAARERLSVAPAPSAALRTVLLAAALLPFLLFGAAGAQGAAESLQVDAGEDAAIELSAFVTLAGAVTVEPAGASYEVEWSMVEGPRTPLFESQRRAETVVVFSEAGDYTLRLTARSGDLSESDEVRIFVAGDGAGDGAGPARTPGAATGAVGVRPDDDYYAPVRAFPGAEGYGANATGGRGGRVMFITNRNDSGPGSARAAFEADGRRIVVPLVWGYVDLEEGIRVTSGDLTYAGQFMPEGNGLALRNMRQSRWREGQLQSSLFVEAADNLILRYLKVYRGVHTRHPDIGSSILLNDTSSAILDHVAVAFGNDEGIGLYGDGTSDITVQHSWSVEPLHYSTHPKTSGADVEHGMGLQVGGGASNVSLLRNYFYLVGMRVPRVAGEGSADIVNNYAYNVSSPLHVSSGPGGGSSGELEANLVANTWEPGPVTQRAAPPAAIRIQQDTRRDGIPSVYLEGNINPFRDDRDTSVSGQWEGVTEGNLGSPVRLRSRVDTPRVRTTSAEQARDEILTWGGPSWVVRDGKLVDVRDGLLERAARSAQEGTGPNRLRTGIGRGKDWEYPSLPSGSISEREFWDEYFGPWRDANYPGREWSDVVGGYMVLEHYLNSWVPDFLSEDVQAALASGP